MPCVNSGNIKILKLPAPQYWLFPRIEKTICPAPVRNLFVIGLHKAIRRRTSVCISHLCGEFPKLLPKGRQRSCQVNAMPLKHLTSQTWGPGLGVRKSRYFICEYPLDRTAERRPNLPFIALMSQFYKISHCLRVHGVNIVLKIFKMLCDRFRHQINFPYSLRGVPMQKFNLISCKISLFIILRKPAVLKNLLTISRSHIISQLNIILQIDIALPIGTICPCQKHIPPRRIQLDFFPSLDNFHFLFQSFAQEFGMVQNYFAAADTTWIRIFIIKPHFHSVFPGRLHCQTHTVKILPGHIRHSHPLSGMNHKPLNPFPLHLPYLFHDCLFFHITVPEPKGLHSQF